MFAHLGRHIRQQYAGFLALFVALGGVSYAAATLPANSVGSKQIKRGAVKSSDIGTSAVTSSRVKNGSLRSADFGPGQLPAGAPGAPGARGAAGSPGATGLQGPKGDPGAAAQLPTCPAGQVLKSNGSGYDCAADDDTKVEYEGAATRGVVLDGTTFGLTGCPAGQLLKSTGGGTYGCASDVDTNTTYSAGGGLQQSGTQFSIATGGVTGTQVADGSLTAADLGFVRQAEFAASQVAHGNCLGATTYQTAQFAAGQEGDFSILSSTPALPLGFVLSGRVGPVKNGFREYYFNVCNFTGSQANVPNLTVRMLVIGQ